jgi:hypothetical protein
MAALIAAAILTGLAVQQSWPDYIAPVQLEAPGT